MKESYSKWIDEYLGLKDETQEPKSNKTNIYPKTPQDSWKPTKEQLLKEAYSRYGAGDSVKCLYDGTVEPISKRGRGDLFFADDYGDGTKSVWATTSSDNNLKVYSRGIWADIYPF